MPEMDQVKFSDTGAYVALSGSDGRLRIWDTATSTLKQEFTPASHLSAGCTCLEWSPTRPSETKKKKKRRRTERETDEMKNKDETAVAIVKKREEVCVGACEFLQSLILRLGPWLKRGFYVECQRLICQLALKLVCEWTNSAVRNVKIRKSILSCLRTFCLVQTPHCPKPLNVASEVFSKVGIKETDSEIRKLALEAAALCTSLSRPQVPTLEYVSQAVEPVHKLHTEETEVMAFEENNLENTSDQDEVASIVDSSEFSSSHVADAVESNAMVQRGPSVTLIAEKTGIESGEMYTVNEEELRTNVSTEVESRLAKEVMIEKVVGPIRDRDESSMVNAEQTEETRNKGKMNTTATECEGLEIYDMLADFVDA